MSSIAAVILAGGRSSRMGGERHKLLLPLGERPVLFHVIDNVLASQVDHVILVLGFQSEKIRSLLTPYSEKLLVVDNPEYAQGMSTSLCKGIATVQAKYPNLDGAIVVLGDQPLITSTILNDLITLQEDTGKRIVVSRYKGKRGSPTLFDASLFPELLLMTGDEGGRKVIEHHKEEVAALSIDDESASFDVDTWEAYLQVVDIWHQRETENN